MTNLRAPASRASSTFCFRSWRFPTINCPSTPTTTTPRLSFVRLKLMSAPRLEGRRPPPCPQYHRPSRRATGRRPAAPAPGGWARSPPTRRAAAPVCMRCCRCQDRGTQARWRAPPRASLAPCGRPRRPQRRVALQLAVAHEAGTARLQDGHCLPHALDPLPCGAAPRAVRQERDDGLVAHDAPAVPRRGGARVRELGRRRLRHDGARSEEHTSELQSRTLISYAVFCLK